MISLQLGAQLNCEAIEIVLELSDSVTAALRKLLHSKVLVVILKGTENKFKIDVTETVEVTCL